MRYLIDTNILIFAISDENHCIDRDVTAILDDSDNVFYVSSSSVFEALHLYQTGRISTKFKTVSAFLKVIKTDYKLQILHSKPEHFDTYAKLPTVRNHNDPVDKIIIAQAITEKMTLISSDRKFKEYKELDFIYNRK